MSFFFHSPFSSFHLGSKKGATTGKRRGIRRAVSLMASVCLLPFLFSCSSVSNAVDTVNGPYGRVSFDLASPPIIYTDTHVMRGDMQVMVHPTANLLARPTALFVPLGVTQDMVDARVVSQGISYQIWQQFLQRGAFSTLELAQINPPHRVEMALPLARRMGAEMLVGGYVTYYFDGGNTKDSKVSIQLEVYDVGSGDLIWSIAHAAMLPYHTYRDFLILQAHSRRPADPIGEVIRALGADFAQIIHMWTSPGSYPLEGAGGASGPSAFGRF